MRIKSALLAFVVVTALVPLANAAPKYASETDFFSDVAKTHETGERFQPCVGEATFYGVTGPYRTAYVEEYCGFESSATPKLDDPEPSEEDYLFSTQKLAAPLLQFRANIFFS